MVILLTGASGFIGRHLTAALLSRGHHLVLAGRHPPSEQVASWPPLRHVQADFTRDFEAQTWLPRLEGVDVVINSVGIIREQGAQTFDAIHRRAACALFAACEQAGVKRVIQISALGADEEAQSRYHLSKKAADDFLAGLALDYIIVQPSLVYGADGASATLFTRLASLPLLPRLGNGLQMVQPLHVDDLTAAIAALPGPEGNAFRRSRITLAGPQMLSLPDFLEQLRRAMGMGHAATLPIPMPLVRLGAALSRFVPGSLLDTETLQMLERGNTGDPQPLRELLGHAARPPSQFITPAEAEGAQLKARLGWLLPILRLSVALVWIVTGLISFGIYPVEGSYELLAAVGIGGVLAPVMLYGAAALDLAIGIAILALRRQQWRCWLWILQAAVISFYSVVIAWRLPQFWLHPYGPMLKNLPMLAAIWVLYELEKR